MFDEIWCLQLACLPCKKVNDWYKTDSNLVRFSRDKSESKDFLVEETLSQVCSTDRDESKGIIADEIFAEENE